MPEHLDEETFTGKFDFKLWSKLWVHVRPHRRWVFSLLGLGFCVAIIDASLPQFNRAIVDRLTAHPGAAANLTPILLGYVATLVVFACFIFTFIVVAGKITTNVSHDIRDATFKKLQDLSFSYFDRRAVGWLMSRLTGDCGNLSRVASWGLLDVAWGSCAIFLTTVLMLLANWQLALVVMTIMVPMWFTVRWFKVRMLKTSRALRKANSITTGAYNEGIVGVRTSKSLVREEQNLVEFKDLSRTMYGHAIQNLMLNAAFLPIVTSICTLGVGLALWRGGVLVLNGSFSLGTLVMFANYTMFLMFPAQELANAFTMIQGAQASAERITSVLDEPLEIQDSEEVVHRLAAGLPAHSDASKLVATRAPDGHDPVIRTLEFRHVKFQYKSGPVVLHDFNLTVNAGDSIALVGATGGGKSTIVSLLCRFYEPTGGEVLINGVEYRQRSLHWLQSQLGMVPQQPHLFSGTVKENIRYGRLGATDAEIEAAAKLTRAHDFIVTLKDGYDAKVGEGGNQLSTGQKQLIALARAIVADPQIFVLDEATSSVDTHTERFIQQAVDTAMRGRISFVIAHRLSTIKRCDRILVIDGGRIVEHGSHHDLLAQRGRYYELYTQQFTTEHEEQLLHATTPA